MRYLLSISLIGLLSGCLGANKPQPESASFDFGLGAEIGSINSNIAIGPVTAIDAIDHRRIRYRLNYQNPSQVFTYSQQRWTTSPADLMASKLSTMTKVTNPLECMVKIQIEAFDHVFDSPSSSVGIVKLQASLYAKRSRDIVTSVIVQESAVAPSVNAKGGVAALDQASTAAITKIIDWANKVSLETKACAQG